MEHESTNPSSFSKNPKQPILENLITNFSQERFDYVFVEVNKLLSDYPTSFKLWNILGAVNTQMQKTQEAMQCYEKAIELRHDYAEAHNNLGNLLKNEGQHEKAIISYKKVQLLNKWKSSLGILFGEKANDLEVEGNYYYNTKKCGIGFHGDSERKKVIACSLGESRPIHWQWYQYSKPIGERIKFTLDNGDMYIMSEKTTGYDWKKRNIKTLRHAAGTKYVK